jgi:signal transduction histidine kinase
MKNTPSVSNLNYDLEAKIFRVVSITILLFSFYAIAHDTMVGSTWLTFLADIGAFMILCSLFILSKWISFKTITIFFTVFLMIIIVFFWFLLGGVRGPDTFNFISLLVCTTALTNGRTSICLISLIIAIIVFLVSVEFYSPELLPIKLASSTQNALPFHFILSAMGISVITYFIKQSYHQERLAIKFKNRELDEKNQEIFCQNEELQQQQETIIKINQVLEEKIKERTWHLEQKNEQLKKYTFLNAHKLRGPLARALGLVYVLKNNTLNEEEHLQWLLHLNQSLLELDKVVYDMNDMLEKEV